MTSQLRVDRISPANSSEIIIDGWEIPEIEISAGANSFATKITSELSISSNVNTRLTFDTELFDPDGVLTDSNFTAPVAGKYLFSVNMYSSNGNATDAIRHNQLELRKNGTKFNATWWKSGSYLAHAPLSMVVAMDLVANDEVNVYANINIGNGTSKVNGGYFGGFRII